MEVVSREHGRLGCEREIQKKAERQCVGETTESHVHVHTHTCIHKVKEQAVKKVGQANRCVVCFKHHFIFYVFLFCFCFHEMMTPT